MKSLGKHSFQDRCIKPLCHPSNSSRLFYRFGGVLLVHTPNFSPQQGQSDTVDKSSTALQDLQGFFAGITN